MVMMRRWTCSMLLVVVLVSLLHISNITAAASSSRRHTSRSLQDQSSTEDDGIQFDATAVEESEIATRIVIEPFQLQLRTTTAILSGQDLFDLRDTMEIVAFKTIVNRTTTTTKGKDTTMGTLELIKFGAAKQVYNTEYQVLLVKFGFGIAQYNATPTPDPQIINTWINESFTYELLPVLQSSYPNSISFQMLDTIGYALQTPNDEPPYTIGGSKNNATTNNNSTNGAVDPGDGSDTDNTNPNAGDTSNTSKSSNSKFNVPLIAGIVAGAAVLVVVIIGFAAKKQQQQRNDRNKTREITSVSDHHLDLLSPPDSDDTAVTPKSRKKWMRMKSNGNTKSAETSPTSIKKGKNKMAKIPLAAAGGDDGKSVADSESEWTLGTEAGDTVALKNIALTQTTGNTANNHNNSNNDTNNGTYDRRNIDLVLSESFERDRNVAITKDMLTGQWSGRISNRGSQQQSTQQQSESVLQPSHFTASQEKRVRKAAQRAAAAAAATNGVSPPDRETSSVSSKGDADDDDESLVFEQVHGGSLWSQLQDHFTMSTTTTNQQKGNSTSNGEIA